MALVLLLPFFIRRVEEELEAFLFVMGVCAVSLSHLWSRHLVFEVVEEPIKIAAAVLIFGFLFRLFRDSIRRNISRMAQGMGIRFFLFSVVVGLGLFSGVITAIISALILVEVISGLSLSEEDERRIVILACYSIGLGAALTPIGEPLSTIATAKLSGEPHHADFFFLARLLWPWVLGGCLILGALAIWKIEKGTSRKSLTEDAPETLGGIFIRAGKVYVFVAALVLLGKGFMPIVDRYLLAMPKEALYWLNMISAVLDNATLAAAEISPKMDVMRIEYVLLGLLISGGMLIPGNIPNIICANKLGIKSRDWARGALPLGLILMGACFLLLQIFGKAA